MNMKHNDIDFRKHRGFTLLEVLLATVLMAALLLTLWSLIGTYASLFATGQARVEQSQIARSLLQQIGDDLAAAIQDTAVRPRLQGPQAGAASLGGLPAADPASQIGAGLPPAAGENSTAGSNADPAAVRRFGLFGSLHELRVDVLQTAPAEAAVAANKPNDDSAAMVSNQFEVDDKTACRAPELRTVYYKFTPPRTNADRESALPHNDDDSIDEETPVGLIREELDFENRNPTGFLALSEDADSQSNSDSLAGGVTSTEKQKEIDERLDDGSILLAPEVVGLEFRYFDGSIWTSQWDSITRESLPAAVEVRLQIASLDPRAARRRSAESSQVEKVEFVGGEGEEADKTGDELDADAEKQSRETAEAEEKPTDVQSYRLIVELPTAGLHKGVQKTASSSIPQPPQPLTAQPLNQTILPPPPDKSKQDENAPQKWMRNDQ